MYRNLDSKDGRWSLLAGRICEMYRVDPELQTKGNVLWDLDTRPYPNKRISQCADELLIIISQLLE